MMFRCIAQKVERPKANVKGETPRGSDGTRGVRQIRRANCGARCYDYIINEMVSRQETLG